MTHVWIVWRGTAHQGGSMVGVFEKREDAIACAMAQEPDTDRRCDDKGYVIPIPDGTDGDDWEAYFVKIPWRLDEETDDEICWSSGCLLLTVERWVVQTSFVPESK